MSDETRQILVTGASGLLGGNVVLASLDRGCEVVAVSRRHPVVGPGVRSLLVDLSAEAGLEAIRTLSPAWAINCAAETDVDRCEISEAECHRLNADVPRILARWARRHGVGFVHISTDAVFDGRRGGYREDDDAAPVNVYGRSKLAGERAVLDEMPDASVVRTAIYGWNMQPKQSLAEWFLDRLRSGIRSRGFADVVFSPILASDLAELLLDMTERRVAGIYHVAGVDAISKYDFGVRIAEVFGLDPALIDRSTIDDGVLRATRGRDLSLSVDKVARALGRRMPSLNAGLRRFKREGENGTLARLKALGGAGADA